ncbi:phosphoribosylamine--glycine ligase [Chlamydiota bacterium]
MKVLVIGSGGREHALCWKIKQSNRVSTLYCAPGNAGIATIAKTIDLSTIDSNAIVSLCKKEKIDLVVIGPELPLTAGLEDVLRKKRVPAIGPNKLCAQIESSKIFSKNLMQKYNVQTAECELFCNPERALDFVKNKNFPLVIKADGLAAGKGVIIVTSFQEASDAINQIMVEKVFRTAGDRIIVEEFLSGEEASILAFVDGTDYIPLVSSQDHKKVFNEDKGPNTGGMGAYSPAPIVTREMYTRIENEILRPIIMGIQKEGLYYQGILYAGIMITENGPSVLEFNVRFGDPETQAILPRLSSDIIDIFEAQLTHKLSNIKIAWNPLASLCVVMASGGYPGTYEKGEIISGIEDANQLNNVYVFHAGTKKENGKFISNGGRVLGVTALGEDIYHAQKKAYEAVKCISFKNAHFRTDIGYKAIEKLKIKIENVQ